MKTIHRGMGSDLMALCGRMEGSAGMDQVRLSYVDEQVTCVKCLQKILANLRIENDRLRLETREAMMDLRWSDVRGNIQMAHNRLLSALKEDA